MPWYLLITINVLAFTGLAISIRWALRDGKYSPALFSIVNLLYAALFYVLFGLLIGYDFSFSVIPQPNLWLGGFLNIGIFLFVAQAIAKLEVGPYSMILNLKGIMTIGLSAVILNEVLSGKLILGALLILIAALMVSYQKGQKIKAGGGELYALLAAAAISVAFVNEAYVLDNNDIDLALFLAIEHVMAAIGLIAIYRKQLPELKNYLPSKDFHIKTIIPSLCVVIGLFAIFEAFEQDVSASLLTAIAQTTAVVIVIAGVWLLNEKDRLGVKIAAAVLSTIGLIILSI